MFKTRQGHISKLSDLHIPAQILSEHWLVCAMPAICGSSSCMCTPGAGRGHALDPESLTTYCRRQGQPSKVPSVPSTFSELEALGTEDLAAAVTDEERYTRIVRDLMAASNVVQVGVWCQPLLLLHAMRASLS